MRRGFMNIGIAAAAMLAMPAVAMEPEADHTPAPATIRTRHKPSGSKPVPGGGAKERAKRLARMMDKNPDGVTVPCDVCGLPVDPRADACSHCG